MSTASPDTVPSPRRLSRRQALGIAAGGVLGAAGFRVAAMLPQAHGSASQATSAAGPDGAWPSPLGSSRALAAHLLRRAGFGYDEAELDQAAGMSYDDLVEKLLAQKPEEPPALPVAQQVDYRAVSRWWYAHMATTAAQFPERMTLFWHGHLTSDFRKANRLPFVHGQNALYRRLGTGDFRSLLLGATYDPLMIRYLDLDRSTAKAPNENFAREVMELYTLGVGNYGEQDVREGARALSGIRVVLVDGAGNVMPLPKRGGMTPRQYVQQLAALLDQGAHFEGRLLPRQHDRGSKTFLGRSGNLGPEEVVDTILRQPSCAPFVATKALVAFCTPTPSRDLVARVAKAFKESRYGIVPMMRAIFTSDEFKDPSNYRSLVRSPVDYMVAAMRALGRPDMAQRCVAAGPGIDQVLYDPPTVAGWPSNAGWVSSSAWLARVNFAQEAVSGGGQLPDPSRAVLSQLDGVVGADTAAVFKSSSAQVDRWYALIASPEFQLK